MHEGHAEERIYALIAKAIATTDAAEVEVIMEELRAALKEHIRRARAIALPTLSSLAKR